MKAERTKVDDLASVITKGTTPTTLGYDYVSDGVRFLRAQNINNGQVIFNDDDLFISSETNELLKRSIIQPEDVLLSIAGTVGRSAVVPKDVPNLNCNQAVAIIRLNSKILPRFFRHWLDSTDAQRQMSGASVTMTISNLSLTQIKNLQIPLPPLAEQQRIAAILDKADALRVQRRAALAKLDTLLQSTFLHLFGDPVTNPKGWEEFCLEDVCAKITDGTHFSPPIVENGIPYVTAKHIRSGKVVFESDPWFISQEEHEKIYSRCDPKPGDVLYIKDGVTTGMAAINEYDFEFSMLSSLALLRVKSEVCTSIYLREWLNNSLVKSMMLQDIGGAAIKRLTLTKIKVKKILVPPLELQHQFENKISEIEAQKKRLKQSLFHLDNLFHTLQQRAFHGEL